jgi:deoxyinosine 3'endonuclease (endonuclease V)
MRELSPCKEIYYKAISALPPEEHPQVIFVDGHGRWHEREAGLATALGVSVGIPTIGIGKAYHPLRPDLGMWLNLT